MEKDTLLRVLGEWAGWRSAHVRYVDLDDVHWFQPSGAPRAMVHGYVLCTSIVDGEIPHNCQYAAGPHRLLVCVLKAHTPVGTYAELVQRADWSRRRTSAPSSANSSVL